MSSSKEDAAVGSLVDPLASEAEAAQVAEMRAALHDEIDALPSRDFPDVTGDIRMLRFLRGFDHSVPQALAAVRDMLDTRRRYGLDALRRWADVPCHHIDGGFPHQEAVTRHKPGLPTVGLSHDGHVIAYEPLRLHRYAAMLEEIGEESMLEFYLAQCESRMAQLQRLSEEQGRMVKMVLVIDLRNVNVWQLTSRRWAKYDEAHQRAINRSLAEALAKVYCINVPNWALGFYRSIKWWIPANTLRKITLLGSSAYEAELLRVMSPQSLHSMLTAFDEEGNLVPQPPPAPAAPAPAAPAPSTEQLVDVGLARESPRSAAKDASLRVSVAADYDTQPVGVA